MLNLSMCISPPRRNVKKVVEKIPILFLAPFRKRPTIQFMDMQIGKSVTKALIIKNPSKRVVKVKMPELLLHREELTFSSTQLVLQPNEEKPIEVTCRPTNVENWPTSVQFHTNQWPVMILYVNISCEFREEFWMCISPPKRKFEEVVEQIPILFLAPFNKRPIIEFMNMKIGKSVTKAFLIMNPSKYMIEVDVPELPNEKSELTLSSTHFVLLPNEEKRMEVTCRPTNLENWQVNVQFYTNHRPIKILHVTISCDCTAEYWNRKRRDIVRPPNKRKCVPGRKQSKVKPHLSRPNESSLKRVYKVVNPEQKVALRSLQRQSLPSASSTLSCCDTSMDSPECTSNKENSNQINNFSHLNSKGMNSVKKERVSACFGKRLQSDSFSPSPEFARKPLRLIDSNVSSN